MELEMAHIWIRLVLTIIFAVVSAMVTWSLAIAWRVDYGLPWKRRPGSNGRSVTDGASLIFFAAFLALAIDSIQLNVREIMAGHGLELTDRTIRATLFVLVIDLAFAAFWWFARTERRGHDG